MPEVSVSTITRPSTRSGCVDDYGTDGTDGAEETDLACSATSSFGLFRNAPAEATAAKVPTPTTQRTASAINPRLDSFRSCIAEACSTEPIAGGIY
jgi:hypothetical protein